MKFGKKLNNIWKLETGNHKMETKSWKMECGNTKMETGSWKSEGCQKKEVGSQKPLSRDQKPV